MKRGQKGDRTIAHGKIAEGIYYIDAEVFGISGFTSVYLIVGEEMALIEAGPSKSSRIIIEGIKRLGFEPCDISYLIVTHIHLDHGGGSRHIA